MHGSLFKGTDLVAKGSIKHNNAINNYLVCQNIALHYSLNKISVN